MPRLAVALPYWSFWKASVAGDLRETKSAMLQRAVTMLQPHAEVVLQMVVSSREDGKQLATQARERGAESLVILQTMAVPPAYLDAALRTLPELPLIIWAVGAPALPRPFDHGAITTEGATVGVPMLTNLLVRRNQPFQLVFGPLDDEATCDRVIEVARAAMAAAGLRRARIGQVGQAPDGYDSVKLDPTRLLHQTGMSVVPIEPAEVRDLYEQVPSDRLEALRQETELQYDIEPNAGGDSLDRSLRLAAAMDDLVARHELDAGAMNCHVPEIRFGKPIEITPCFALGRLTSAGIPWSCAGDTLTAIAMLCLKRLGGAALYHEVEAVDPATGEFVLANTGEHDLAFAGSGRPRIVCNGWFEKDSRCGVCAQLSPPAGPATLVGFTELDVPQARYRLIAAAGDFTERAWPAISTPSASFRFHGQTPADAWTRWCRTGVNHHSAATPGDYLQRLEHLAGFAGWDFVAV
jgi:L-fucose isomerase-like protein